MTKGKKICFVIISIALFLGASIPTLVLSLINTAVSKIPIIIDAHVLAWLLLFPWFILDRNRFAAFWIVLLIAVPLFLFLTEQCTNPGQWFFRIALPEALTGSIAIGLAGLTWIRFRPLYALFLTVLIAGITGFIANHFAVNFIQNDINENLRNLVSMIITLSSVPFLFLGMIVHRGKIFSSRQNKA